jgi:hypothetical protein
MRRPLAVYGLAAAALALGVGEARAQTQIVFDFHRTSDSAVGAVPGAEFGLPIRAFNFGYPYYLASATVTVFFDPAKVTVIGAASNDMSVTSTSIGTGSVTVSAYGFNSATEIELFDLRLMLNAGVTDGAYLWMRVDAVDLQYCPFYCSVISAVGVTRVGQVCYATELYGDVDADARIGSRDALIVLSAAVGLPVSGFNLGLGDVDADGLTNSRDALMMMSYAIGLPIYTAGVRVGQGIPVACPGVTAPGEDVVFVSATGSADTLLFLAAASTTPAVVTSGGGGTIYRPRLRSDGAAVTYVCRDGFGYDQICRISPAGTGFAQLTSSFEYHYSPDWSPDTTQIGFRSSSSIWKMSGDGSNQAFVYQPPSYSTGELSWSRNGLQFAYSASNAFTINVDGTLDAIVPSSDASVETVRWSPAGDSLAYVRSYPVGVRVTDLAGGFDQPFRFETNNGTYSFDWGPQGFLVALTGTGRDGIWLLPTRTGPIVRLTRGSHRQPSFRRNP